MLLSAPTEVRDNILKFLIGNQMIHVKFLDEEAHTDLLLSEDKSRDPETMPSHGGLCAAFCVAEKSEQAAYEEAIHSSEGVQVSHEADTIETCKERHKACLMCGAKHEAFTTTDLTARRLTFSKDLAVLAVCRLLYEESNNILWETNTFSFDDPESFKGFITSLIPSQKSKFRKMHLSMRAPIDEIDDSNSGIFPKWEKAMSARLLTSLKNLKILHITFDQYKKWPNRTWYSTADSQVWLNQSMKRLLRLRMLRWKDQMDASHGKHVTVVITGDASTQSEGVTPRWSKAQQLEAAEAFRALLADPNSPVIHKAESAATRIEAAENKAKDEEEAEERKRERQLKRWFPGFSYDQLVVEMLGRSDGE